MLSGRKTQRTAWEEDVFVADFVFRAKLQISFSSFSSSSSYSLALPVSIPNPWKTISVLLPFLRSSPSSPILFFQIWWRRLKDLDKAQRKGRREERRGVCISRLSLSPLGDFLGSEAVSFHCCEESQAGGRLGRSHLHSNRGCEGGWLAPTTKKEGEIGDQRGLNGQGS